MKNMKAWDYLWSSARRHVNGIEDPVLSQCPLKEMVGDWKEYLIKPEIEGILNDIRKRNLNGLPLGEDDFIESLAVNFGVKADELKSKPHGRPRKR